MMIDFMVGGSETTTNALSGGILLLLRDPAVGQHVAADLAQSCRPPRVFDLDARRGFHLLGQLVVETAAVEQVVETPQQLSHLALLQAVRSTASMASCTRP